MSIKQYDMLYYVRNRYKFLCSLLKIFISKMVPLKLDRIFLPLLHNRIEHVKSHIQKPIYMPVSHKMFILNE